MSRYVIRGKRHSWWKFWQKKPCDLHISKWPAPKPGDPDDKRLPPLDEATPTGWCAVQAACVHRCLDERGVPREEGGKQLSLWGRVLAFKEKFVLHGGINPYFNLTSTHHRE